MDIEPYGDDNPAKLMFISYDSQFIFMRDDKKNGVKILSLEDGSKIGEIKNLHKGDLNCVIVSKDNRHIITSGNDKKIKVYDWVNELLIHTLSGHNKQV